MACLVPLTLFGPRDATRQQVVALVRPFRGLRAPALAPSPNHCWAVPGELVAVLPGGWELATWSLYLILTLRLPQDKVVVLCGRLRWRTRELDLARGQDILWCSGCPMGRRGSILTSFNSFHFQIKLAYFSSQSLLVSFSVSVGWYPLHPSASASTL